MTLPLCVRRHGLVSDAPGPGRPGPSRVLPARHSPQPGGLVQACRPCISDVRMSRSDVPAGWGWVSRPGPRETNKPRPSFPSCRSSYATVVGGPATQPMGTAARSCQQHFQAQSAKAGSAEPVISALSSGQDLQPRAGSPAQLRSTAGPWDPRASLLPQVHYVTFSLDKAL